MYIQPLEKIHNTKFVTPPTWCLPFKYYIRLQTKDRTHTNIKKMCLKNKLAWSVLAKIKLPHTSLKKYSTSSKVCDHSLVSMAISTMAIKEAFKIFSYMLNLMLENGMFTLDGASRLLVTQAKHVAWTKIHLVKFWH